MKVRSLLISLVALALVGCGNTSPLDTQARGFGAGPGFTQANTVIQGGAGSVSSLVNSGPLHETSVQVDTSTGTAATITLNTATRRLQLTGAGTLNLGGLKCSSGADCAASDDGSRVLIENRTNNIVTLPDQNGATAANDRFKTSGSHGLQMEAHGMCEAMYVGATLSWRLGSCGKRIDCQAGESEQFDGAAWQCRPALNAIYAKPMQSGRYYFVPNHAGSTTSAGLGNGTLRLTPFWVPNTITVQRIGSEVTVIGDAGSKLRLGIYADDGTGRPGSLLLDAGTIAGDSATVQEITGLSLTLAPGVYWVGGAVQLVATTQPTVRIHNALGIVPNIDVGSSMPTAGQSAGAMSMVGVTGALPSTFTLSSTTTTAPRCFIKVQ